jgi:hypothetical protein
LPAWSCKKKKRQYAYLEQQWFQRQCSVWMGLIKSKWVRALLKTKVNSTFFFSEPTIKVGTSVP